MKTKSCITCAVLFAIALTGQAIPLTNSVPFGEALTWSLHSLRDWHPHLQFEADELIYYRLHSNYFKSVDATNQIPVRYLAFPYSQTFDFQVFDDKGNEVRKTIMGWYYTKETTIPKDCEELALKLVIGSESSPCLRPTDMFAIKKAGTYELEVRMKICVPLTNSMPDIKAMTSWRDIHESTSNPHLANTNWGILTSDPVRVKIIKE